MSTGDPGAPDDLLAARRRRLVRVAMAVSEAGSGAFYAREAQATWRSTEIEGLFPPLGSVRSAELAGLAVRAELCAAVFRGETLPENGTWLHDVARSGCAVAVVDATCDSRIPRHIEPALALRSLLAVPINDGAGIVGIIVVANPVDGGMFPANAAQIVAQHVSQAVAALTVSP